MLKQFLSFYQRRIYIPEKYRGLVLDVGSGDKPHFCADILVDNFIEKKHGAQRNGSDAVMINKPLFVSDIQKMPFRDKVFDYVIASHVLEHVKDPRAALKEITRVGKAGYIEAPSIGYQKLNDFCSHLWYCDYKDKTIIFTAKTENIFDKDIDSFIKTGKDQKRLNISILNREKCILKIFWKNNLKCKVIGKPNENLMSLIEKTKIDHNVLLDITRKLSGYLIEKLVHQRKKIHINNLVKKGFMSKQNYFLENKAYVFPNYHEK